MEIYLPIAEMSVQWIVILGMGLGVGFLSGLFGVGGGFLLKSASSSMMTNRLSAIPIPLQARSRRLNLSRSTPAVP